MKKYERRIWVVAFRGRPIKHVPAINFGIGAVRIAHKKSEIPEKIAEIKSLEPYKSAYHKRWLVYKSKHGAKVSEILEMFRLGIDFPANYPAPSRQKIRKRWYLY